MRRTVFIVGAGASAEVKFPVGRELADRISSTLNYRWTSWGELESGDPHFFRRLYQHHHDDIGEYKTIASEMSRGVLLAPSIDTYIDKHSHESKVAEIGKAAIVQEILRAERGSDLFVNENKRGRMDFIELRPTWFARVAGLLTSEIDKHRISNAFNGVTVVCFNYDRCIEQYLAYYFADLYGVKLGEARQIVGELAILRPYGSVGSLVNESGKRFVEFGADPERLDVVELGKSIRTFTEQVDEEGVIAQIREAILAADTLVFLGFHYLRQNMLLIAPKRKANATQVFGTAFERSDYETSEIEKNVRSIFRLSRDSSTTTACNVRINNKLKCAGLFAEYGLGLDLRRYDPELPAKAIVAGG